MTIPENLDVYISALMFVVGAYAVALYLGLIVWTFQDIRSRSRDFLAQIMSALLVTIFTLPGLLIYLLLRPKYTLAERYEQELAEEAILQELDERHVCPECQHRVEADFIVCPYCEHQLRLRCVGCGRLMRPGWHVCPYCGLYRDQEAVEELEQASEEPETEDELEPAVALAIHEDDTMADGDIVSEDKEEELEEAQESGGLRL
jgi:RNA polymerase subunit RPABC4/transcription elongation factor Spt4